MIQLNIHESGDGLWAWCLIIDGVRVAGGQCAESKLAAQAAACEWLRDNREPARRLVTRSL